MKTLLTSFALLMSLATSAQAQITLTVFDCGRLMATDISAFNLSNDETPVRELFAPCYLIQHPQGTLLWDSGLQLEFAGKGVVDYEPGVTLRYDVALPDQLAAMDITPADIDLVAFSHMHWDHVGAANLFTDSTLLIQDAEYQAAFVDQNNQLFDPSLYLDLADSERRILNGDYDVFGDGSVMIISAPGHTPGHQVLLVELENTGPVLLSGDLYHFRKSRELRRVPLFNTDAEETLRSMDKIEALLKAEQATLWIEHDQALADTLKKAPEYYD